MYLNWSTEDVNILTDNYNKYGAEYCSKILNRSVTAIRKKAEKIGISINKRTSIYTKEILENIIKESISYIDCLKKIGIDSRRYSSHYKTLKKYIILYNIDISHFDGYANRSNKNKIVPLKDVLVENSYYNKTSLKRRLLSEGYLENKCCLCGQDENWNGMKISLILDHINGVSSDDRIENLRIVCPNCNAGLDTFAGKNILKNKELNNNSYRSKKRIEKINKCSCGKIIQKGAKNCKKCKSINSRKIEWPDIDTLIKDYETLGYTKCGEKYGVSGTSILYWIKSLTNNI